MTAKKTSAKDVRGRTDWKRVDALTNREIERMASADTHNPATRAADWADAVVGLPPLKTPVNARFDVDVVDWFKAQGRGYHTRMNAVLRHYMESQRRKAG
ncbi:BrnA antitoxin family protein [Xanthobacteraceae bacterium Astr-EGSB]|uniref:BrnA antitoxin family protein n=1 Tax=Astrobacterium formosum TaxID=3069710 RepID=UPI0027B07818|nr:BrnA antitoxin family protein [Xanthobacteraceae bacterium Astr-EGSB]